MAEIRPFRGVRYNQELVGDLAKVICPPYDIITPELQQELYRRSVYNFVRLEYGREQPQDTPTNNRYTRSATLLRQWLEQGVLVIDPRPAIYLHRHYFSYQGKDYSRRSLIALVRLEPEKMTVRPHEGILIEHKSDRLSLLWALEANTSPILALYHDERDELSPLLTAQEQTEPIASLSGEEGHKLWAITEPKLIQKLSANLANQPLYIADGHHRYESALTYRQERISCASSVSGEEGFNFVMMSLVHFADPGLLILPPHRLVRGLSSAAIGRLKEGLSLFFSIEKLPLNPHVWQQVDHFLAGDEADETRLAIFGCAEDSLLLLKLNAPDKASELMPCFHSKLYKRLNVSILDHVILEKLLGLGGDETNIGYTYSQEEAVSRVEEGEYQLAFILGPVKPELIKAVADAGERMPRKSTYFYPKAPAGLVFYRLV